MKNVIRAMFAYMRRHAAILAAVLIAVAVFAAIFSLYKLPVEAVLYASLLSLLAFCVIGAVRFAAFYRRHRVLHRIRDEASAEVPRLPPPASVIERDYQDIVAVLDRSRAELVSQKDRSLTETTDYYTLWAHQIKTPIAAMRLLLDRERGGREDELSEQLFRIEQYVEMALGYLRAESMSGDLLIRECALDDIVKQTVKKYARSFIRKKLTLTYSDLGVSVMTDAKWLSFVLEQLLSNALKYTPSGGISIYMDGPALVVEDTGIGIRPEDLPRIGERGFTGYNGHEDKKSTGIGMYLCKKILKKLSHTLAVESEVGRGTRVKIGFVTEI